MKISTNTKLIIIAILIAIIFAGAGSWISEIFRVDPVKKEMKEYEKKLNVLRDSIHLIKEQNKIKLQLIKRKKNEIDAIYRGRDYSIIDNKQLDSLRSEFRRKTGG